MQLLKRIKWPIILVAALSAALYLSSASAAASDTKPVLEIPSPRHDAGSHWEGDVVSHTFEVRNTGNGELRILSVKPG